MLAHFACFSHNCICHFRQVLPQHLRTALNFSLRKKEVPLTARRTNAIPDRVHSRAIHCQVSALGKFLSDTRANLERTHTPQLRPDFTQSRCQSALEPLCSEFSVVQRSLRFWQGTSPITCPCTRDSNVKSKRRALLFVSRS